MERAQDSELRALILPPLCPPFGLDYVLGVFVHHIFSGEIEIIGPILQTCFEEKKHPVCGGASVAGAVINVVCNCLKKKVFSLFPLFTSTAPTGIQSTHSWRPWIPWMCMNGLGGYTEVAVLGFRSPGACDFQAGAYGAVKWVWRSESSFFTNDCVTISVIGKVTDQLRVAAFLDW